MKVFAAYLINLLDYAKYQNVHSNTLEGVIDNENLKLYSPEEMIDTKDYLLAFDQIIKASSKDYFGLNFGCYLNMDALGLVLQISLNTSSIEQGVLILQNFLDNKFPLVTARVIKDAKHYILQLDSSIEDSCLKQHLLDMVLSIIYRELKLMLPFHFGLKIRLPFIDFEPYDNALDTKVAYGYNYQIVLPIEIVNTEINANKIKEIEILLPKFIAMSNENWNNEFAYQIRSMTLKMCSPEIPNFEQVQMQFPYSKRTVQRKLTDEGTSFRDIVNKIKEELSNYLINEKHLKIKDIAYILGYSESSAYLHAVKSWGKKKSR